jgi:hypothetical protein
MFDPNLIPAQVCSREGVLRLNQMLDRLAARRVSRLVIAGARKSISREQHGAHLLPGTFAPMFGSC